MCQSNSCGRCSDTVRRVANKGKQPKTVKLNSVPLKAVGVEKKEFTVNQMKPYVFSPSPLALLIASKSTVYEATPTDLAVAHSSR